MGVGELTLYWCGGGQARFQGVSVQVLALLERAAACTAVHSGKVQKTAQAKVRAPVTVPAGMGSAALHFLSGCGWARQAKVRRCRIIPDGDTTAAI